MRRVYPGRMSEQGGWGSAARDVLLTTSPRAGLAAAEVEPATREAMGAYERIAVDYRDAIGRLSKT